jgi:uncharacterized protein (DUF302 family)
MAIREESIRSFEADGFAATWLQRQVQANPMSSPGIVRLKSPYLFADTVQRLLAAFAGKGIKVFATIDQQAEARAVGLSMPPTTLIVFGNPKAGTPLMLANPEAGIDLPLKVLVCEDQACQVVVLFTAASEIIERYSLPPELASNLKPAEFLITSVLSAHDGV